MKQILNIIVIFLFLLYISSCDQISKKPDSNYYVEGTNINTNLDTTGDSVLRKALIIDFTGIRCVNCPDAHDIIKQIKTLHPGRIVAVAIHGTSLAYPIPPYKTDLRTTQGNDIINTFGINSIPVGLINSFDKTKLLQRELWAATIDTSLEQKAKVDLKIYNMFNSSNRELKTIVIIKALKDLNSDNLLSVYLLEDSIITRQATVEEPGYIDNYVQLNVFRSSITNVWGEQVSGLTHKGDVVTKEFITQLDTNWNENNCKIVAFIRNNSNFVLNAEQSNYVTQ